ncbi:hypothetical protein [Nostoc punctiforme]|uniref:hypothetical protein n=1 Tax=Nostoc punctiforme TaxID=272131 RepID=UPI0030ECFA56
MARDLVCDNPLPWQKTSTVQLTLSLSCSGLVGNSSSDWYTAQPNHLKTVESPQGGLLDNHGNVEFAAI